MILQMGCVASVWAVAVPLLLVAQSQPAIRMPDNLPEPVGEEMRVSVSELDAALADGDVLLLDVREPWELEKFGTLKGYINIPIGELEARLDELSKEQVILTA